MSDDLHTIDSEGANWTLTGQQLLAVIIAQCALSLIAMPVRVICVNSRKNNGALYKVTARLVGVGSKLPIKKDLLYTLFTLQLMASSTIVVLWIFKTYAREVPQWCALIDYAASAFCAFHYTCNLFRFEGSQGYVWNNDSTFDVLTIVPLLLQENVIKTWLSFGFLRSLRAFKAYARLEASGALDDVSDMTRAILLAILKFISLLICFAGGMFIVEVLGEFKYFTDQFIDAGMGAVSFYQMVYFIMVTVSTVGYGDFSPVTVLGRLFIIFFIVAGVAFFSIETGNILDIVRLTASGRGKFYPKKKRGHVIVTGGAVTNSNQQVLMSFLNEMCHPNRGDNCPEVILLALRVPTDEMQDALASNSHLAENVKYINGSALRKDDLVRCRANRATMLYVLGDMAAPEPDKEDEENIMRGAQLHKLLPTINLRMMLLRPENRQVAADIGLPVFMCFSVNEIKSNLMAQGSRCPGFSTLMLNLIKQDNNKAIFDKCTLTRTPVPAWQSEFMDGCANEIYGFMISSKYTGKAFHAASREIFESYGVCVFAVQAEDGVVLLGPKDRLIRDNDVCFVIADDESKLDPFRDAGDWIEKFKKQRRSAQAEQQRKALDMKVRNATHTLGSASKEMSVSEGLKSDVSAMAGEEGGSDHRVVLPGALMVGRDKWANSANPAPNVNQAITLEEDSDPDKHLDASINEEEERQLSEITKEGGHVIIVGMASGLWQQIFSIIKTLRKPWLKVHRPMVVITGEARPNKLKELFPDICFITGVAQKLPTLLRAGANAAHDVLVLSGSPTTHEQLLLDRRAIILSAILDSQKDNWQNEPRKVLELHSPNSVAQLSTYSLSAAPKKGSSSSSNGKVQAFAPDAPPEIEFGEDVSPEVHPLLAAGTVLYRGDLCQLWACSLYTPGILEIVESLLGAGNSSPQTSYMWLVPVPTELVGASYAQVYSYACECGGTLMGLLRPKGLNDAVGAYVHTNPGHQTKTVEGDKMYVLAGAECSLVPHENA